MNIKLLHPKNNVVSIINAKFQAVTIIFEVIAVLVSPYAFGIFLKTYFRGENTKDQKRLKSAANCFKQGGAKMGGI